MLLRKRKSRFTKKSGQFVILKIESREFLQRRGFYQQLF